MTEEQKARALEAQKRVKETATPLTINQMQQLNPAPQQNMMQRFQNNMRQNPFMRNRMSFEEKYWAYKTNNVSTIEDQAQQFVQAAQMEENIIPPSLEDDPNQSSPLPPDVANASEIEDLDAYIRQAQEAAEANKGSEQKLTEVGVKSTYENMSIKELKEAYVNLWGDRDVSHNNNKKNLIDLVTNLVVNGSQEEETSWNNWNSGDQQDGSTA